MDLCVLQETVGLPPWMSLLKAILFIHMKFASELVNPVNNSMNSLSPENLI